MCTITTTEFMINMKLFVFIILSLSLQFGNVIGIHDQVHHSTMRTVYDVQLDHFEILENTETVITNLNMRIKKYNRTTYILAGTFETIVEFDDNFAIKLTISALQGNEYKVIVPSKDYDKLCTFLTTEKMIYPEVYEHSNFPEPGLCPAPPGKWALTDYSAQNSQLPELPSAGEKWKGDMVLTYKNQRVAHVSIYAIVTSRRVRVDD